MTEEEQIAEALKYSSAHVWHFAELRPALFALYNHKRQLQLITNNFAELLPIYRARPAYVPPPRPNKLGIDLTKLDISL